MRVGVTRADDGSLAAALRARGATPVDMPAIAIHPVPFRAPAGLFDGVAFASPRAVFSAAALARPRWVAAVGSSTAASIGGLGWAVDVVPARSTAADLLGALTTSLPIEGTRWWLPRAERGRTVLEDGLAAAGADVVATVVYRTDFAPPAPIRSAVAAGLEVVTFASGSAVASVLAAVGPGGLRHTPIVSIGPVTSQAVRDAGWEVAAEAVSASLDALADAAVRVAGSLHA